MRAVLFVFVFLPLLIVGSLSTLWSVVCFMGGPHPTSDSDALSFGCLFLGIAGACFAGAYLASPWRGRRDPEA